MCLTSVMMSTLTLQDLCIRKSTASDKWFDVRELLILMAASPTVFLLETDGFPHHQLTQVQKVSLGSTMSLKTKVKTTIEDCGQRYVGSQGAFFYPLKHFAIRM